jgi:hypothetical protein
MRIIVGLLALLFASMLTPLLGAQEASLAGHWEGAIVIAAAEQEVDVVAELNQVGGQLKGQVWFPITSDGGHEVEDLHVQGSHVSFAVHDADGVISAFEGSLSPDGASLQGTMKESGAVMPFTINRVKAPKPAREIPVSKLGSNGNELKRAFNADAGNVRMILLLDPRSYGSRVSLRIIERYVMDRINDPNLRVYAVWIAPDRPEAGKVVRHLAELAPDPRITHFWATEKSFAKLFEPVLALYKFTAEPCMLFGPDKSWTDPAPFPDGARMAPDPTAKEPLNPAQRLNGNDLAADVRRLLVKRGHN